MALITCPECGREVSDRAITCPNCGCPIAAPAPNKSKKGLIIGLIALVLVAAIGAGVYTAVFSPAAQQRKAFAAAQALYDAGEYDEALSAFEALGDYEGAADGVTQCRYALGKACMDAGQWAQAVPHLTGLEYEDSQELLIQCAYQQGIAAMEELDWETAADFFTDLSYGDSEKMLTDCRFMLTMASSVMERAEMNEEGSHSNLELVQVELDYLREFRDAQFYDPAIVRQAEEYIAGVDMQAEALLQEDADEAQRLWLTGMVQRFEALNQLYTDYGLLADNQSFVEWYINDLQYQRNYLNAFTALEDLGYEDPRWRFTGSYVDIRFVNATPYNATLVFEFEFFADEQLTKPVGSTDCVVDISPFSEYTVRAIYTSEARSAYYSGGIWIVWSSYYRSIEVDS